MSELIPWIIAIVGIVSFIITWYYFREQLRLKEKEIEELQKQEQNMRRFLENKQRELTLKKGEMAYNIVKDIANFFQSRQDAYNDEDVDNEDY